jgi:hypothetical protein
MSRPRTSAPTSRSIPSTSASRSSQ